MTRTPVRTAHDAHRASGLAGRARRIALDPLRFDLNPMPRQRWARRAARYLGHQSLAPIYSWDAIAERLEQLSCASRDGRVRFVRHGTTNYNLRRRLSGQHNTVLTDVGRIQAAQLASSLPSELDLIACSALARAIETMELAIGEARLRRPVLIDPRLNEVNFGRFQGCHPSSLAERSRGNIDYVPGGGESYRMAAMRIFSFVADLGLNLTAREAERTISVIFCHTGILRILSTLIRPVMDPAEMFAWRFGNASSIDLYLRELRLPVFWLRNSRLSRL